MTFSAEELATLTEEERAGMLEELDEQVATEPEALAEPQAADAAAEPEALAEPPEAKEPEQLAAEQEEAEPEAAAEPPAEPEPVPEAQAPEVKREDPPRPLFVTQELADIDGQLNSLDQQKLEWAEKFDEGLCSDREKQEAINRLDKQQHELRKEQSAIELNARYQEAEQERIYNETCYQFIVDKNLGGKGNPKFDGFNMYFSQFQDANRQMELSVQLDTAYRQWCEAMGLPLEPAPAASKPASTPASKPVPRTLAQVPAAELESTDNGRWAALNRLAESDPLRYQDEALPALSELELQEYDAWLANHG